MQLLTDIDCSLFGLLLLQPEMRMRKEREVRMCGGRVGAGDTHDDHDDRGTLYIFER